MKQFILFFLMAGWAGGLFAESNEETAKLPVALMVLGDQQEELVARVKDWAEENLAIPVPVLPAQPEKELASFVEVADYGNTLLEADRLGLVVLWRGSGDETSHGAFYPEQRVAIVNLNALMTEGTDQEVVERRIERQVIRGICLNMGLEPNPNPHSAMFNYSTMEELDAIGRNLDPPWLMRLQEKAMASGIPVDRNNPFNLVAPLEE
jgi:hypothetical protein